MKKLMMLVAIAILYLTFEPAFANGSENGHNNGNGHNNENKPTSQIQGQEQVQGQLQSSFNRNQVSSSNINSNTVKNSTSVAVVANPVATASGGIAGVDVGNSVQSYGGQSEGSSATTGDNVSSTVYNQVKQVPMAWSPNMAMSMSNENCANSTTFGASAGFGAISGGMPIDNDGCNRRMDVRMWVSLNQMRVACERMRQDKDNAEAMVKAGVNCASLATVQPPVIKKASTLPPDDYWVKAAATRDAQLNAIKKGKW